MSLFCVLLTSCTLLTHKIEKSHSPQLQQKVSSQLYSVFIDIDPVPAKQVGIKKGGYNNDLAKVVLEKTKSDWIKDGLTAEFKAYGYEVLSTPAKNTPHVRISINQLFIEPSVMPWGATLVGICDLSVRVKTPSRGSFHRNFVETNESFEIYPSENDYEDRFTGAVNSAFSNIVVRTHELLTQKD